LAELDFGASIEQPFGCIIVQNHQAVQRSIDWALEDDMLDGLFFCATLTGRRGGHTPFVQAGAETSDAGAEAVKPDPGSSWEGHSGGVCTGVWNGVCTGARKFSVGGIDFLKIDKNSAGFLCFMFQFWEAWSFAWTS